MTSLHDSRSAADTTSLELLFEHGYTVRDVLRAIRSHLKQSGEVAPTRLGLGDALEKLESIAKQRPADARDLGL